MRLDITPTLTRIDPVQFDYEWDASHVDLGSTVQLTQPVQVKGSCTMNADIFLVEGTITWHYATECDRCLKAMNCSVTVDFSEEFVHREDPDFPDRYLFAGQLIDLAPMAEDLMILNQPISHVCKPDCKGLCPVCGKDRNESICDCEQDTGRENPFAVLKDLLASQEEETK